MNKRTFLILVVIITFAIILGMLEQTVPDESDVKIVTMKTPHGEDMGTIQLSETAAGVLLNLDLKGLTANGEHAMHIHETGQCIGSFKSAGGHYNPTGKSHGMKHPEGHHAGDMPNLKPNAKGKIQTQILNQSITLETIAKDDRASVYDLDGSAIIIHAAADDHMSQPSGAAGARIACGVIQQ